MKRILHTMLRVADLDRSIDFYTSILGMSVLRSLDQPDEQYTLAFLGYGKESEQSVLELTYNYGVSHYDHGNAYGHIAIEVSDIVKTTNEIKKSGISMDMEPARLKGSCEIISFFSDPDGYQIELIERQG